MLNPLLKIINFFSKKSLLIIILCSIIIILLVGTLDYFTSDELPLTLFYLIPIAFTTWTTRKKEAGLIITIISIIIWNFVEILSGKKFSHNFYYYWNILIMFGFYYLFAYLLFKLKKSLEIQKLLARTDSLTGIPNSHYFNEVLENEILRDTRYNHPVTLSYIDLDNFKFINDTYGHSTGDKALQTVANTIKNHIRSSDTVARVGGDEFIILFPETDSNLIVPIINKLKDALLDEMLKHKWDVTFSIGVYTCTNLKECIDDLIKNADNLMYYVKKHGKNAVKFQTS